MISNRNNSGDSLVQRLWRPAFMVLLMVFLAVYGLVLPAGELIAGHQLAFHPRWADLPERFWDLMMIALGSYVGGRSLEKIAATLGVLLRR